MGDLISRKDTIKALRAYADRKCVNGHIELANGILNAVCLVKDKEEVPTVEAVPVVHGEWRHIGGDEWCCSECGNVISTEGSWEKPTGNFCEECGADMRKKV